jgi:hypothetical protein
MLTMQNIFFYSKQSTLAQLSGAFGALQSYINQHVIMPKLPAVPKKIYFLGKMHYFSHRRFGRDEMGLYSSAWLQTF